MKSITEQKIALYNKIAELASSKTACIQEYQELKEKIERVKERSEDSGLSVEDRFEANISYMTGFLTFLPKKRKEVDIFLEKTDLEIAKLQKKLEAL
jgi:hypothetical protein